MYLSACRRASPPVSIGNATRHRELVAPQAYRGMRAYSTIGARSQRTTAVVVLSKSLSDATAAGNWWPVPLAGLHRRAAFTA